MRRFRFTLVLLAALPAAVGPLCAQNPVLGVVTGTRTFSIGSVDQKPESGAIAVVNGDDVSTASSPVTFRLTGENRAVMGENSKVRIRPYQPDKDKPAGAYFYQTKGSLQYEARREPLAICAGDRLYVPSVPGSGVVTILPNRKVQVTLATGTMERSGSETCNSKAAPAWLVTGLPGGAVAAGTTASATAAAAATATATATATAASAGVAAGISTAATIGVVTATTTGIVAGVATSQAPDPQSQITPGP
jgi:hypothetical protein